MRGGSTHRHPSATEHAAVERSSREFADACYRRNGNYLEHVGTIDAARDMVADGIGEIVPYAEKCGIRLAIEPLHPMYAAERSVIVTLEQANQVAARFPPERVGVIVDVFHVWWDPQVYEQIAAAGSRIFGFHVSDWMVPLPDMLMGRGMMGKGIIEIRRLRNAVESAGYIGPIEVEIFNHDIWNTPLDVLLREMKLAYREVV